MARKQSPPPSIESELDNDSIDEDEDEVFDVPVGDDDLSGYPDDDTDFGDLDDDDDDDRGPRGKNSATEDFVALEPEVVQRVNPKRWAAQKKGARQLEGIASLTSLSDPEVAKRAWAEIEDMTPKTRGKTYRVDQDYELDDVIKHPKFGRGYVVEILSNTKFTVLFEDGLRRLMYNIKR